MKKTVFILLLLNHVFALANSNVSEETGRALANYQACSNIALDINDQQMFSYYRKMYNDAQLTLLMANGTDVKRTYNAWEIAEKLLLKVDAEHLKGLCQSRFEPLTRKMLKK